MSPRRPDRDHKISRQNTTLRTTLAGLGVATLGLVLIGIGSTQSWFGSSTVLSSVLIQTGGILFGAVALLLVWDLVGRRAFARELLAELGLASVVAESGLLRIGTQYLDNAEWDELLARARTVDIFVAYAATWRRTHWSQLQSAVRRGAEIRVYLPDPSDGRLLEVLASRFGYEPEKTRDLINEAIAEYSSLGRNVQVSVGSIEPVFSCYRFDDTIVATMYRHSKERGNVPVMICRRPGLLYDFFSNDLAAIAKECHPRLPPRAPE